MSTPQDLTLSLLAAADARAPDDSGTFLVYEKDNDLFEQFWTGSQMGSDTYVASDVKENSPATYLMKQDKRLIFYVNTSSNLECRECATGDDSWDEAADLPSLENIAMSPQSKLSASMSPAGITLFFQDIDGKLRAVSTKDGAWEVSGSLSAAALPGTPLCTAIANKQLNLFYMNKDSTLHYVAYDPRTDTSQDHVLEHAHFDGKVVNFAVNMNRETQAFESYCLADDALYSVDQTGKKKMGDIKDEKFIAPSGAQSGYRIRWFYSYVYEWW